MIRERKKKKKTETEYNTKHTNIFEDIHTYLICVLMVTAASK